MECQCTSCKNSCQHKPGWLVPGEAEKIATFLGLTLPELFKTKLMVDWWEDEPNVFLLSPAITTGTAGTEFDANPKGKCVFFKNGLCQIHAVKPFECRESDHTIDYKVVNFHKQAADAWRSPEAQQQVCNLLGREPVAAESDFLSSFFW